MELRRLLTGALVMGFIAAPAAVWAIEPAPYYADCDAAHAAGVDKILDNDPAYRPELDPDKDGMACDEGRSAIGGPAAGSPPPGSPPPPSSSLAPSPTSIVRTTRPAPRPSRTAGWPTKPAVPKPAVTTTRSTPKTAGSPGTTTQRGVAGQRSASAVRASPTFTG